MPCLGTGSISKGIKSTQNFVQATFSSKKKNNYLCLHWFVTVIFFLNHYYLIHKCQSWKIRIAPLSKITSQVPDEWVKAEVVSVAGEHVTVKYEGGNEVSSTSLYLSIYPSM